VIVGADLERGPTLARISSILLGLMASGLFTLRGALIVFVTAFGTVFGTVFGIVFGIVFGAAATVLPDVRAAPMVMS